MTGPVFQQLSNLAHAHRWYRLFSRGARDWLRHNEKVRDAVREQLPEMIAGADILSRPSNHTVQIPVHFLEHYRFRLNTPDEQAGVGQGGGRPAVGEADRDVDGPDVKRGWITRRSGRRAASREG